MLTRSAALLLVAFTTAASAQTPHRCAADAVARAPLLLRLHLDDDELAKNGTIDRDAKVLAPIRALKGDGRFDVLEVWGHVYKADYRLRFLYARIEGSCVLMGQEIIEASNPH